MFVNFEMFFVISFAWKHNLPTGKQPDLGYDVSQTEMTVLIPLTEFIY